MSVGAGQDSCASSLNSTVHQRPGPDRSRSTGLAAVGREAARGAETKAARENIAEGPRRKQRRQKATLTHTIAHYAGTKEKRRNYFMTRD